MDRDRARKHIEQHEGRRFLAYRDSVDILTVGVGFNLEDADAHDRIEALGVSYEALCAQRASLSNDQIDCLFHADYDSALREAALIVPDFWNHPEDVQLAMLDMRFNLGGTRFTKFVKLMEALKNKDYMKAADEMANSLWARQVPNRAAADIALVRGCAT